MTLDEYLRWCGTVDEATLEVGKFGDDLVEARIIAKSAGHVHKAGQCRQFDDLDSYIVWLLTNEIDNQIQERLLPSNGETNAPSDEDNSDESDPV